jgi:Flp pilus assembly protein TadD
MRGRRALQAGAVTVALVSALAGCGDEDTPSDVSSAVSSAAEDMAEELREIRDGIVATDDAEVRETSIDDSGRAVAKIAVTNNGDETDSYTVQVNFHDKDGDLVDSVLVTVSSLEPGETAQATARSHRDLPARTTADVVMAVRH